MNPPRWAPLVLTALSCGAPDATGTLQALVFSPDSDGGYAYAERSIEHVVSLRRLESTHVAFRAGTRIDPQTQHLVDRGVPFELAFHFEHGVAHADEDASLDALTAFANLNQCAEELEALGAAKAPQMDVYFYPRMDSLLAGDLRATLTDNAAYGDDAFFIIPPFVLRGLPLQSNLGVMCHEYGHSIIEHQAFAAGDAPEHIDVRRDFMAMHEGVADLFGYVVSGNANFIAASLSTDLDNRDLSAPRPYLQSKFDSLPFTTQFDPHDFGSYLARAIYQALPREVNGGVSEHTRASLGTELLHALDTHPFDERDSMGRIADAWLKQLQGDARSHACEVLKSSLAPLAPFEACP